MRSKNPEIKLKQKKQQWVERTAEVLHVSEETAEHLLRVPRQQSIRSNTLKADPKQTITELKKLGWRGAPFEWCPNGFTVESDIKVIRDSELATNGSVYIQNAASWLPVLALDAQPGDDILDVCAAPGGKTGHIAAVTGNKARITANDNSKPRLAKIRANMTRMGVDNVYYTMYDAVYLSHKIYGRQYDKILLDAPCSGEGMMTLDNDKDFTTWSVAHIKRLQQLQKRILVQAWQLLKPGGTLVYSTCTMASEENEMVIDYLLRHNEDVNIETLDFDLPNRVPATLEWNGKKLDSRLSAAIRLIPSPEIEAFFVCKLKKTV